MIISVPSSLNLSHSSLVSRWHMTCRSSSQFERSWSRGFIGEGALPLVLPASSVSGSSSVSTSCDVGVGAAAEEGARFTPETLGSLSEIDNAYVSWPDIYIYQKINGEVLKKRKTPPTSACHRQRFFFFLHFRQDRFSALSSEIDLTNRVRYFGDFSFERSQISRV